MGAHIINDTELWRQSRYKSGTPLYDIIYNAVWFIKAWRCPTVVFIKTSILAGLKLMHI